MPANNAYIITTKNVRDNVLAQGDAYITKKRTEIPRSQQNSKKAEGTGFEPADTLRYRQFSKLLV